MLFLKMTCGVLILFGCVCLTNAYLPKPDFIYPCSKYHDFNQCAIRSAQLAIPSLLKGSKKYRIPNLMPLTLPIIDIPGANNFHLQLKNVEVYGLDRVIPQRIDIDFDERKIYLEVFADQIVILGDYILNGRLLIFPINGYGPVNITLIGGKYSYKIDYDLVTKEGKEYLRVTGCDNDYELQGVKYDFKNLFHDDATLSEHMNNVLNENWRDVNADLKNSFTQILRLVPYNLLKYIYNQVPFNELFVD